MHGLTRKLRSSKWPLGFRIPTENLYAFFSAFAKSRKVTISCVMSCLFVHMSVRMEQLGSHWIWNLKIFRKSVDKITRITCTLHEDFCTFMTVSRWCLLWMRNFSGKRCRGIQNIIYGQKFFSPWNSYRLWDNVEKYMVEADKPHISIIRRMCFAWWITLTTDTDSEYVMLIAFRRQQWLCERPSILRLYVHCLSSSLLYAPHFWPISCSLIWWSNNN